MAYVSVPKDLTHVKSKMLFGLTKRQIVCFGAALLMGLPLFFMLRGSVPTSAAALVMIFAMLPGLLFSWAVWGLPSPLYLRMMACISRFSARDSFTGLSAFCFLDNRFHLHFHLTLPLQHGVKVIGLIGPHLGHGEAVSDDLPDHHLQRLAVLLVRPHGHF